MDEGKPTPLPEQYEIAYFRVSCGPFKGIGASINGASEPNVKYLGAILDLQELIERIYAGSGFQDRIPGFIDRMKNGEHPNTLCQELHNEVVARENERIRQNNTRYDITGGRLSISSN